MTGEKIWEKSIIMTDVISFTVSFITKTLIVLFREGFYKMNWNVSLQMEEGLKSIHSLFIQYLYFVYK